MKTCYKCEQSLSLDQFANNRTTKDGLSYWCKLCHKAYRKEHYNKNSDRYKENAKQWREDNPELCKQKAKVYQQSNKERCGSHAKKWKQSNPDKLRYYSSKRRRGIVLAEPSWADRDKMIAFYTKAEQLEKETGERHHVDHIIPIIHPLVCGLHNHFNLQVLTASDNLSKSNRFEIE